MKYGQHLALKTFGLEKLAGGWDNALHIGLGGLGGGVQGGLSGALVGAVPALWKNETLDETKKRMLRYGKIGAGVGAGIGAFGGHLNYTNLADHEEALRKFTENLRKKP